MQEISLEKVDQVRERTGVTYGEAKEALEKCEGNVLDAIIYLEDKSKDTNVEAEDIAEGASETIEEFKTWLKDLIKKGNVARIKIKKDDKELADIPVNAGVAATVIAVLIPQILAFGVIAALAIKITVEITMTDGSVKVVNKYISKATEEVKETATKFAGQVKEKVKDIKSDKNDFNIKKTSDKSDKVDVEETVYSYTVNFEDENKEDV